MNGVMLRIKSLQESTNRVDASSIRETISLELDWLGNNLTNPTVEDKQELSILKGKLKELIKIETYIPQELQDKKLLGISKKLINKINTLERSLPSTGAPPADDMDLSETVIGKAIQTGCGVQSTSGLAQRHVKLSFSNFRQEGAKIIDASHKYLLPHDRGLDLINNLYFSIPNARENSLTTFLNSRLASGQTMTILDSGAGAGYVMRDLLSYGSPIIEKCTGISLHYFKKPVEKLFQKYQEKVEFHVNRAQNVLPTLPDNSQDLIIDVQGSFLYSENKATLIEEYYRTLKPEGKAFICWWEAGNSTVQLSDTESIDLTAYLTRTYPTIFSNWIGLAGSTALVISKHTNPPPLTLDLHIKDVKLDDSGAFAVTFTPS